MLRRLFPIALLAIVSLPASATASDIDGEWTCKANGNIPMGILTITGMSYRLQETDAGGTPNGKGGSGSFRAEGPNIVPNDGPLVAFEASGNVESSVLYWNNTAGTVMACWQY